MTSRSPGMPLRARLVTTLLDRVGRAPIEDSDLADIEAKRATVYPTWPPFSWITGRVDPSVRVTDGSGPVRDGGRVPLRWYHPGSTTGERPLVVYLHGGGWVQGSTRMYDPLCTRLAAEVGATVVSVDYRMAPEHLAPTAVHDCLDVVTWLVDPATGAPELTDTDRGRVALAGDSAGGNLAAVLAQELRTVRSPDGAPTIRHQALIYPATDMTMSSPSIEEHADAAILTRDAMYTFRNLYLHGKYGPDDTDDADPRHRDPLLSPLFGDVVGVAPALVQVGELDPLRDDGTRYAAHLRAAGVEVRESCYRGLPHGFISMPGACPGAEGALEELVGELRRHLGEVETLAGGEPGRD